MNYRRRVLRRLAKGELHATLGNDVRDAEYTRSKAERWLTNLIELGLRPGDLCVEYGCGSLWCAEPFIKYMDRNCYIGLDVTDAFYEMGRNRLGILLETKAVRLAVVSRGTLKGVAAMRPRFVFSRKVLPHVPRRALPRYVASLVSLMNEQTIVVIDNTPQATSDTIRGRRHSIDDLIPHLPPHVQCAQLPFALVLRQARHP